MANARSEDIKTPLARLAFARDLFTPRTDEKSGRKSWGCTLLFPKSVDLAPLKENALSAAKMAWGDKAEPWLRDGMIKSPFLDGDGKQGLSKKTGERHAGYAGHTFIRCQSGEKFRPALVNQRVLPITSEDDLYSGCYVYAVINFFAWDSDEQGKGLSAGISMIQKAKDGERIGGGGGVDVEKWAEVIDDEGAPPAETKSGAGAAGLFG